MGILLTRTISENLYASYGNNSFVFTDYTPVLFRVAGGGYNIDFNKLTSDVSQDGNWITIDDGVNRITILYTETVYATPALFLAGIQALINNPGVPPTGPAGGDAIRKMIPRLKKIEEQFNEERHNIEINNCQVDADQSIVYDNAGRLKFTQAAMIKRNLEWKELLQKEITIEPYIATDVPELHDEQMEAFEGFVIPVPDKESVHLPLAEPNKRPSTRQPLRPYHAVANKKTGKK